MRLLVKFLCAFPHRLIRFEDESEKSVEAFVHFRLAQTSFLYGFDDIRVSVFAGGHLQFVSDSDALHAVVAARPIGDHHAVVSPFSAQDLPHQMRVFVGVHAVEFVVGGHHRFRLALLHRDLEAGQVNLPKRPLVHHRVNHHSPFFLIVRGEVFEAGGNALALDAAHIRRRHLAREVRILRKILEIASAKRIALDVESGSEQHVDALRRGFLAQKLAHSLAQFLVPGVCHGGGCGEAGGGDAGVKP